ncbi:hypothetical protein Acr_19g0009970 [Actinidia rufa]|uniref:Transmembrane protein n=1 Tax=Actinidia rufa TaxID=165716 RepID=A0A7J0GB97_9ERIC|nr:hypothetical protein Acr_19g0009970 [Actinidia rufa]
MDGSDKGFSSSKPSSTPKFSTTGGTNENDQNYDKIGSKCQNPKKSPMKYFMSPTISAASKVQAPRKKILAERNEISNFSDPHLHTSQNLDSKPSSESGDDEQNNSVSDSSSKPYDPFMNYLSPRPKFLRYKPNRRNEIFLSQENEILKYKDGSGAKAESSVDGSGHSSLIPTLQEGSEKQEGEEITIMTEDDLDDDVDEEIEEFEKENCLSLKGVLKFLLVIAILFSSTLYISSMNSPIPIWGLKNGYCEIHNHTLEVETSKIFEEGLVKSTDKLCEVVAMENEEIEDVCDHELDEAEEVSANGEGVYDVELEKKEEGSIEEGFVQLEGLETVETAEKSESFQDCQTPSISDNHRSENSEGEDTIEESDEVGKQVVENKVERVEGHTENVDGEIVTTDGLDSGNTETASGISEGEVNSVEVTIKHPKTDLIPGIVIGFLIFLALSVVGFRWRRKKIHVKQSLLTKNSIADSVLAEKISPVVELLGEFEVGGVSSSIRSCTMKSKIMETEMSYNSGIKEKGKQIESNVVSSQVRPFASGLLNYELSFIWKLYGREENCEEREGQIWRGEGGNHNSGEAI